MSDLDEAAWIGHATPVEAQMALDSAEMLRVDRTAGIKPCPHSFLTHYLLPKLTALLQDADCEWAYVAFNPVKMVPPHYVLKIFPRP